MSLTTERWAPPDEHLYRRRGAMCTCVALTSMVAVFLYATQYVVEAMTNGDVLELSCTVEAHEEWHDRCIVVPEGCDDYERGRTGYGCSPRSIECWKTQFTVSFATPGGRTGLATTPVPDVFAETEREAREWGEQRVGTSVPCWFNAGGDPYDVQLAAPAFKASVVPVIMFGVFFVISAVATKYYHWREDTA